jgi:hypothetical protein
MSNQQKNEFVNGMFHIPIFWGGHGKISPNPWLVPIGAVYPDFWFSKPVEFSTVVTHKLLTV